MAFTHFQRFIRHEAFAGIVLMLTALAALIADNSPAYLLYQKLCATPLLQQPLSYWINHGLMTFFFVSIGLEIKRELCQGELNSMKKAALPLFAAAGGMIVPALVFLGLNTTHPLLYQGWAIPMATDIAFSLGVMQLLGKRCPLALKVFLMALATFDDLGAVLVIALFYSHHFNVLMFGLAAATVMILTVLHYKRVARLSLYGLLGALLWFFTTQSGIDAAISGIVIAFSIPLKTRHATPALKLERDLHPWVAYVVLPLFAFANAGVHFADVQLSDLTTSLTLGIALGLCCGKPIGVLAASWLGVRLRWAALPANIDWHQIIGVAILCGIGFTMSLFIGELAFVGPGFQRHNEVRLGILLGSCCAGIGGYLWLRNACNATRKSHHE